MASPAQQRRRRQQQEEEEEPELRFCPFTGALLENDVKTGDAFSPVSGYRVSVEGACGAALAWGAACFEGQAYVQRCACVCTNALSCVCASARP